MSDQEVSSKPQPELAKLVRALIEKRDQLDPWLEFPQSSCCFAFGDEDKPLPIGALFILWDKDPRWRSPCPKCRGDMRGLSCGGHLSASWFSTVCIDCDNAFGFSAGRGIGDAGELLTRTLTGTPFYVSKGRFGGAFRSDGQKLLEKLGMTHQPTAKVAFVVHDEGRKR
jgi:hypothetical protein